MTNLFEIRNLKKHYPIFGGLLKKTVGHVRAIDDVSFDIRKGETLGLVGESGCGKTTLSRCLLRLQTITDGKISILDGDKRRDIVSLNKQEAFEFSKRIQIVFQDPYAAMNPIHTVLDSFDEPLRIHGMRDRQERLELIMELFSLVNLQPEYVYRYPHEFSGGQRQRICIARALCLNPEMLVLDEPVSSLDVSIQAQVLNLLQDIQNEKKLTYMFIAHDLSVVEYMSNRIAVMYLGRIVELANADTLYKNPLHPYTQALLSAVPVPVLDRKAQRIVLKGDVPSPANPPSGCHFHTRCPVARKDCADISPELRTIDSHHFVACHYAG